jgi:MFS family permease
VGPTVPTFSPSSALLGLFAGLTRVTPRAISVGTLGFADEIVALVACPVWGLVSDRLGVRWVALIGYLTISASLAVFVQARNVYPQLLLARIFFAFGATAA